MLTGRKRSDFSRVVYHAGMVVVLRENEQSALLEFRPTMLSAMPAEGGTGGHVSTVPFTACKLGFVVNGHRNPTPRKYDLIGKIL